LYSSRCAAADNDWGDLSLGEICMSRFFSQHHSVLHQVFCLLLCFSAWRGPVPVLHDHGWLGSSEQLDKHQQRFHDDGCCEVCAGLHWHLALPEDVTGRELPERNQTAPELAVFACAAASLPSDDVRNEAACTVEFGSELCHVIADLHGPGSVTDRYRKHVVLSSPLIDVPLCAVTGVCLI
jgi:hypothetical protein